MQRKVIKQGHNTLTVTIPIKWANKMNISPGSEITVEEKGNKLLIKTDKVSERKNTEFDITNLDVPTIWKYFIGVYREGFDEVKIKFPEIKFGSPYKYFSQHKLDSKYGKEEKEKTPLEFFHEIMNRFIGFEVVESRKNEVIVKEISEPTAKEFDSSLRRIFLLIQEMAEETENAVETGNFETLKHIHNVDMNLDKFHDYCIRILNKLEIKEFKKSSTMFTILFFLELTGDEFKNIAHHLLHYTKNTKFKYVLPVVKNIRKQLDLFYEVYYNFDKKILTEISKLDDELYKETPKIYEKSPCRSEREILHHVRIMSRYINALTELRIEMEF